MAFLALFDHNWVTKFLRVRIAVFMKVFYVADWLLNLLILNFTNLLTNQIVFDETKIAIY